MRLKAGAHSAPLRCGWSFICRGDSRIARLVCVLSIETDAQWAPLRGDYLRRDSIAPLCHSGGNEVTDRISVRTQGLLQNDTPRVFGAIRRTHAVAPTVRCTSVDGRRDRRPRRPVPMRTNLRLPPPGRWHFRKKMTEGVPH